MAACGASAPAPISNRGDTSSPPPALPILLEGGWRGHDEMPTKQAIEDALPGSTANVSGESIVVELPGVPLSKLVYNGIPAGTAMLVLENGRTIHVFAREVTMSHGLAVGMTLDQARVRHPELTCVSAMGDTTCTLPGSRFSFRIYSAPGFAARIDHVIWVRE